MIRGSYWGGAWGLSWGGSWGEAWFLLNQPYQELSLKGQVFVSTPTRTVFAYSQESLRAAVKIDYPVAFVSARQSISVVSKKENVELITGNNRRVIFSLDNKIQTEIVPCFTKKSARALTAPRRIFVSVKQGAVVATSRQQISTVKSDLSRG